MKRLFLSFFLLGSLLLVSCSGELSSKEVAAKFVEAVNANNLAEAQKYAEAGADVESLLGKAFTVADVQENGDSAALTLKVEGQEEPTALELKKVEGKWLVSVAKQEVKEEMAPVEEAPATEEGTATETTEEGTATATTEAETK